MEICEDYLGPWLRLRRTESGIQLVGLFHEDCDDKAIARAALEQGINVSPLSIQYRHSKVQRGLVMGFAAADEKITKKAMGKAREVLRTTVLREGGAAEDIKLSFAYDMIRPPSTLMVWPVM